MKTLYLQKNMNMSRTSYKTQATYINPRIDEGFKILFGRESSKDILIGFLNDVLDNGDEDPIVDIEYLNKEMVRESEKERTMYYDLHCKTKCGKRFLVEMQNGEQENFISRALLYLARCITEQSKSGEWNYEYMPVIGVFICAFHVNGLEKKVKVDSGLRESGCIKPISDKLRMIYIQLPFFTKESKEECENDFERWVYILKNMETMMDMAPFTEMKKIFNRVDEVGRVENLSHKERMLYDHNLKVFQDYYNRFRTAENKGLRKGLAEGKEIGIQQGIQQGIEQGIEQGLEKGRLEERDKFVKAMHKSGMTAESISKMINIPVDEIIGIIG